MFGWLLQLLRPRVEAPHASSGLPAGASADLLGELHELAERWKGTEAEQRSKGLPQTLATTHARAVQQCGRELSAVLERGHR